MLRYHRDADVARALAAAVADAATFHDLGKLDPENQAALRQGRNAKLPWDHIDAGVAHLRACNASSAAWVVRGHHAPGLPSLPTHFTSAHDRRLRGRRNDDCDPADHQKQIERTDRYLPSMLEQHFRAVGIRQASAAKPLHGLPVRLALSCLVGTLWTAPIILTTAVQFFETLASNHPAALRKLHGLPGSVVFIDEAHGALPTHLLAQNWRWMRELEEAWGCSFVLASGSLVRYWEIEDVVGDARKKLPELTPASLSAPLLEAERARIAYVSRGRFDGPGELSNAVAAEPGPRLLVMNTVQSAAVMAKRMRDHGHRVLHISTALCPRDRAAILDQIKARLDDKQRSDWNSCRNEPRRGRPRLLVSHGFPGALCGGVSHSDRRAREPQF